MFPGSGREMRMRRFLGLGVAVLVLALLGTTLARAAGPAGMFVGEFVNVVTYRLAVLDVKITPAGALVFGFQKRRPVRNVEVGRPTQEFVFEKIAEIPPARAQLWMDTLRSFPWQYLKLVVPRDSGREPYLVIMGRR